MKKFIFRILIYLLIIVIICLSNLVIDPFNVFHVFNIRDVGVEPNSNYIKMTYVLNNPDKFDTFIFGSSRVGNLNPTKIAGASAYNMTYAEGVPKEHYDNLQTLISNGIVPKTVYVGVDSLAYTVSPDHHITEAMRAPYEYLVTHPLKFFKLYCDPAIELKVIRKIILQRGDDMRYSTFYDYGWNSIYGYVNTFDVKTDPAVVGDDNCLSDTMDIMRKMVSLCSEHNVKLVVFTNPLHPNTFKASFNHEYDVFLRELCMVTPFYNFSSLNEITLDFENFRDSSHAKAEVGDIELEIMQDENRLTLEENGGFGAYITPDNIDELVLELKKQAEAYKNN